MRATITPIKSDDELFHSDAEDDEATAAAVLIVGS